LYGSLARKPSNFPAPTNARWSRADRSSAAALPTRIAAAKRSTRASVVGALPRAAAPLRMGDHMPETVVITGASSGVGRATAHAFAARGAQIVLVARGTQGLQAAAAEVENLGGKALALPLDVADPESVEAAAESVENRFGPIDIWVNCAMATIFAPFHRISPEEYRRATEVTYLGFVYGTMAALKRMRPRN